MICGMLPVLRTLAARECIGQGSVCLVPYDVELDSASHLHMILLEAYCRENGIEVVRASKTTLITNLGNKDNLDLSCVLVINDDPYFLETPE